MIYTRIYRSSTIQVKEKTKVLAGYPPCSYSTYMYPGLKAHLIRYEITSVFFLLLLYYLLFIFSYQFRNPGLFVQ